MNETKVYARRVDYYVFYFDREIKFYKHSELKGETRLTSECGRYYAICRSCSLKTMDAIERGLTILEHNVPLVSGPTSKITTKKC